MGRFPEEAKTIAAWQERHAINCYAGHAAQVVLLGIGDMSDESGEVYGAGQDFGEARERLCGDHVRIEKAKAEAVKIVTARRADVEKVAKAFMECGRLDAQQMHWVLAHGLPLPDSLTY